MNIRIFTVYLFAGAGNRIRTSDLLITNELLCQLSYAGFYACTLLQGTTNYTQGKQYLKQLFDIGMMKPAIQYLQGQSVRDEDVHMNTAPELSQLL